MWVKILIVAMLIFIVGNLAMSMAYLVKDQGQGTRALNALKWRVGLSVLLFGGLIVAVKLGYIQPHENPLGGQPKPAVSSD
ncbi:MAG: DUF2909 domain-containing protein [Lysobacterales bacterium]